MSKKEKFLASAQKNLQKNQVAKAIKDYQQILKIDSADVRCRQKLAELLGRDRRIEEALTEYEAVAKHYAKTGFYLKAIAVYKQMQKLDPAKSEIYHHLAELNEKQGLLGNALAEYRNLVAHYEKQKMYNEASAVLQKMRELEPENLNILVKIAEIYAKSGLKDRAREELEHALSTLRKKGDDTKVLKLYEIFLPLYPDLPEMKVGMAQALIQKGETEKGMHLLKNLLQEDPENPEILKTLAHAYRQLEDYVNERLTLQHLLRDASDDLDFRRDYIRACIDSGEITRAMEELNASREVFRAADKSFMLQEFYEELKAVLPQCEQIPQTHPEDADDPLTDVSDLLKGMASESIDPDEVEVFRATTQSGAAEPEEIPSAIEEEREDLEISLDFLEEVAGAEGDAMQETSREFPEVEDSHELELEIDSEQVESFEELDLDNGEGDDVLDLGADPDPCVEEILELELELDDDLLSEHSAAAEGGGGEDILDLDMEDVLEPEDEPEHSARDLRSDLEEAEFYLQQGLLEDAERICHSLLKDHPGSTDILDKLSRIEMTRQVEPAAPEGQLFDLEGELADENLMVLEEGVGAYADSQRGIETTIDVEDTESHYNLGIAYKEMGLMDEAIAEFDKAVHHPARRVGCLTLKGICLAEKGSFDQAEEVLKSATAHPGLSDGERISLLYELGLLYEGWDKPLEALDSFQSAADADIFFRDVAEKVADLRRRLGMDPGEDESGPKGDKERVSYV